MKYIFIYINWKKIVCMCWIETIEQTISVCGKNTDQLFFISHKM